MLTSTLTPAYHEQRSNPTYQVEGLEVDEVNGVVKDVWICGLEGKTGRDYPLAMLEQHKGLYEGVLVNVDHINDPDAYRPFSDRFGWLVGIYTKPSGLWARELRLNVAHKEYASFIWWAKNNPKAIGLSHDVLYTKSIAPDGRVKVEEILKVNCVDLVANPSTTSGLKEGIKVMHESKMLSSVDSVKEEAEIAPGGEGYEAQIGKLVAAIMCDACLSVEDKKKKLLVALKLMEDVTPESPKEGEAKEGNGTEDDKVIGANKESEDMDEEKATESLKESKDPAIKALLKAYDKLKTTKQIEQAKEAIESLCKREGLPAVAITPLFVNSLIGYSLKDQLAHIAERKQLGAKPKEDGKAVSVGRESVDVSLTPPVGPKECPPVGDLLKLAQQNR
jgi:hypothetical protein